MTFLGHASTHKPQPLHRSVSIFILPLTLVFIPVFTVLSWLELQSIRLGTTRNTLYNKRKHLPVPEEWLLGDLFLCSEVLPLLLW